MKVLILSKVRFNALDNTAEGMDTSLGYKVVTGIPLHQIVNGDELLQELLHYHTISEIKFSFCIHTSLWDWELEGGALSEEVNKDALTCTHEWVNVGFSTIKMACKHCDGDAPEWVQNKYEHKD